MTATERNAELEHAVTGAKTDLQRLRRQQQDATARATKLRGRLAARPAEEFDANGQPKPKTEAKRLKAEIDAATGTLWKDRLKAAEQRVVTAERAVSRDIADRITELAAEREQDDMQSVVDLDAALAEVERAIRNVLDRASSWSRLLAPVQGLDPRHELPAYDPLSGLLRVIAQHKGQTRPPVPMSLNPQAGETPNRVRTDHGWITPGELERAERREQERAEQRQRETRKREQLKRVEFEFGREPTPEGEMSLLRQGWEAT